MGAAQDAAQGKVELKNEKEKTSYVLGMDIGGSLKRFEGDIDLDVLLRAVRDVMAGATTAVSAEDARAIKMNFLKQVKEKQMAERKAMADKNQAEGDQFLAENGKREGVKTTASGLQYEVLQEGKGEKPTAKSRVKVNYRGTLIDGTEFDSSYKRGQPASFALESVIPAWTEAVQLMPVGSKYKIYAPSKLAYGERGTPGAIGPNATLIFEIELLEIEK
jgi:FKBP-type peptidyl-prolyl cis-trans isomerase